MMMYVGVVGTPQPMSTHTRPVMNSAASSVNAFGSTQPLGNSETTVDEIDCAAEVTMNEILKPTPVSVTTPITMPTVAAAAPTASAYLAPVSNATTKSRLSIRDRVDMT